VLEVCVHDAQNGCVGVLPAIEDRSGQAPLAFAHQQAHARVIERNAGYDSGGAIGAVVVDDQNLVGNFEGIEHRAHVAKKAADVLCFAKGGNHQRQLFQRAVCRTGHDR
jgi:predicted TIM-barrel enzyme